MCGLAGFIDFKCSTPESVLHAMTQSILHRGPDDAGHAYFQHAYATVGLGFRRLSIIELSALGHQPMYSNDGRYCITFNGEIYNHAEIKKTLMVAGIRFKSNSDTEVILQAYITWGYACVNRFIGMFAFVIYDTKEQVLVACRDRAGVKPLFYYQHQNLFLYGSELKSFHQHGSFVKQIDVDALALYFQHGYIPAPHCIFKHTYKLLPGHWLKLNLKTQALTTEKYWDVTDAYNKPKVKIDYKDAIAETEKLLLSACNYRMVADVPVGIFLSGGYDSSLVTALLQSQQTQKLKTFTIGFEEETYNEAIHAGNVAKHLGTEHHAYTCTYKEALDIIPMLPQMYDEPFADSSAIPTYLVSKMARQHVTVALSADGGDETFAGYTKYAKGLQYINKLNKVPGFVKTLGSLPINITQPFKRSNLAVPDRLEKLKLILKANHHADAFNVITQAMTVAEVRQLLKPEFTKSITAFDDFANLRSSDMLDHFLWLDYQTFLVDDILQKVDRATMAVSLEGREPLIDYRIIEWAAQLPAAFKLHNGTGKRILRDITHKYLPKEIMERPKMGFRIPIEKWYKNEHKDILLAYVNADKINAYGLLNHKTIEKMIHAYLKSDIEDFHRIWKILMLQMWMEKWMN